MCLLGAQGPGLSNSTFQCLEQCVYKVETPNLFAEWINGWINIIKGLKQECHNPNLCFANNFLKGLVNT